MVQPLDQGLAGRPWRPGSKLMIASSPWQIASTPGGAGVAGLGVDADMVEAVVGFRGDQRAAFAGRRPRRLLGFQGLQRGQHRIGVPMIDRLGGLSGRSRRQSGITPKRKRARVRQSAPRTSSWTQSSPLRLAERERSQTLWSSGKSRASGKPGSLVAEPSGTRSRLRGPPETARSTGQGRRWRCRGRVSAGTGRERLRPAARTAVRAARRRLPERPVPPAR